MDNLQIIEALNDAIRILVPLRHLAAGGSMTIWRIIEHAEAHLDRQIQQLLDAE